MGIQAERVRAILFDIDGTLSDSDDLMVQKVERILKPFYCKNIYFRLSLNI